ncbi:MAG: hypothetical protein WC166_06755 [Bacteroidales bacterium]
MFKRIVLTTLIAITVAVAAGAYFYYAGALSREGEGIQLCTCVDVCFNDSIRNRLYKKEEIISFTGDDNLLGKALQEINLSQIEHNLDAVGGIIKSEVYTKHSGSLVLNIQERKPVVRLNGNEGMYYADNAGVLFPVISSIPVPIVTGNISLDHKWIKKIISLAEYINADEFWSVQIEQIDVLPNGDLCLYTKVGGQRIIFGECSDIETKFRKLTAFYKGIIPLKGWDRYREVNLKYDKQIICR